VPIQRVNYRLVRDLSAGSSKGGSVPANRFWTIIWGHVKYTSTATPGKRFLVMRASLPGDPAPLARTWAMEPQEPGSVRRYQFFPGSVSGAGTHSAEVTYVALPEQPLMFPGWTFSIEDSANIDPNDHLEIRSIVILEERVTP